MQSDSEHHTILPTWIVLYIVVHCNLTSIIKMEDGINDFIKKVSL